MWSTTWTCVCMWLAQDQSVRPALYLKSVLIKQKLKSRSWGHVNISLRNWATAERENAFVLFRGMLNSTVNKSYLFALCNAIFWDLQFSYSRVCYFHIVVCSKFNHELKYLLRMIFFNISGFFSASKITFSIYITKIDSEKSIS